MMAPRDPKTSPTGSGYDDAHPEQDPAEGSRKVIESDLADATRKPDDDGTKDNSNGGSED